MAEVAGHLEISAGAVKTRLWRARQALRGELEVLVSDAERKSTVFAVPRDLAEKAKMIAERPPIYESVSVGMQVGGPRWATSPMFEPIFAEQGLSFDDVRFAVERLRAAFVAGDRPLAGRVEFGPGPETFYHRQPVEVWEFLRSAESGNEGFQNTEEGGLVITDGWRLGTDPGAPELLDRCRAAGIKHVWFTFAGMRETHDDLCQRPGAFDAIVEAMKRCRDARIATGANNIVTTRSVRETAEVALLVRSLGGERFVPTYPFTSDRNEWDYLQPEPDDLRGLPPQGLDVDWGKRDFWADPAAFTESALVKRAIESASQSTDAASTIAPGRLDLWVSPDLSLRIQEYPAPRFLVAHLRNDGPEVVYDKLARLVWPDPPSEAELARRYGDPTSHRVFFGSWDYRNGLGTVRLKWLEAWRKENNIPWLPWPWG